VRGRHGALVAAMPTLFVVLWSTGFIGAKFGLPYAEPFTFLSLRFMAVIALLAVVAVATRAPTPSIWAACSPPSKPACRRGWPP
jgi:drug/metabolite transporter (DMT)-like permease